MKNKIVVWNIFNWIFSFIVFTIGLLNLIFVHPVPGFVYLFFSLIYFPPVLSFLKNRFGFSIPAVVKILLGIFIIWFTLGISDLAEIAGL